MLYFVNWNMNPEILDLGWISLRYYGLLFAASFYFGLKIERKMFRSEGLPDVWLGELLTYVAIATLAGARLGHCLFYEGAYYLAHPLEIVLPLRFSPEFEFIGYQGLASHGAAFGIIIGLWCYSKKVTKRPLLWILDRVVVPVALAGFFIRIGNLINSEIVGVPTTMPWGFRFIHSDMPDPYIPRHPAQLYEALCYLASFFVLLYLYWRTNARQKQGFIFGMFLILIFTARFLLEFLKERQVSWENGMVLDMGQWLSVPFVLTGLFMLWCSRKYPGDRYSHPVDENLKSEIL